jgi:hypothetical protein
VRQALSVFVAATPLPRPRPSFSRGRPETQLFTQVRPALIQSLQRLHCSEPPQKEALLPTPVGGRRNFGLESTQRPIRERAEVMLLDLFRSHQTTTPRH